MACWVSATEGWKIRVKPRIEIKRPNVLCIPFIFLPHFRQSIEINYYHIFQILVHKKGLPTARKFNLSKAFKADSEEEIQTSAGNFKSLGPQAKVFILEYKNPQNNWFPNRKSLEVNFWMKGENEK
jgi:hypothetical protein